MALKCAAPRALCFRPLARARVFACQPPAATSSARVTPPWRVQTDSFLRSISSLSRPAGAMGAPAHGIGAAAGVDPQTYVLRHEDFREVLVLRALQVPKQICNRVMAILRGHTLNRPRTRNVLPADDPDHRLVCLAEGVQSSDLSNLPAPVRESLASIGDFKVIPDVEVQIGYESLSADQVLRKLLPHGVEVPGSFETVGHIAHLNIRDDLLPWRRLIGQVILDKNAGIRTVVTKMGTIETEFRTFPMEVIAGDEDFEAVVVQQGCRFHLNFAQVYWNSRLEAEHSRLVERWFKPGQVLCDMMCGVGPFAVRAARRGLTVWANDLNPHSVYWLRVNAVKNKTSDSIRAFNMCGREFVKLLNGAAGEPQSGGDAGPEADGGTEGAGAAAETTAPGTALGSQKLGPNWAEGGSKIPRLCGPGDVPPGGVRYDHLTMNLPASAVEFLDAFHGTFDRAAWEGRPLPMVHCYTFMRGAEAEAVAGVRAVLEQHLGCALDEGRESEYEVHVVRDVAPNKLMLCVSFRLPARAAFGGNAGAEVGAGVGARGRKRRAEEGGEEGGAS